eukprot:TRINITY_DN6644_c0_g1_i1.p1 TRINITY_DN6644_c0_g1~~TRINITY_DN6644_c0_g1_i1.p1  ORF type:complete len:411 (+),score=53.94 TRINITY_DN6644_c0_g1_i1:85-1317(+)
MLFLSKAATACVLLSRVSATPTDLTPFKLAVSQDDLQDLRRRIHKMRWPDQLDAPANDDWVYGTEEGYLKNLSAYWADEYDWRAQERAFNALPQFTATVRGLRLHFVHQASTSKGVPALLLAHGWPGSIWEFHKIYEPLKADFDIVAPSIPGFGFSEAPHVRNFSVAEVARTFDSLMQDLGYSKYLVHGGDWGGFIVKSMSVLFPERVAALHTTIPVACAPPRRDTVLTPLQKRHLAVSTDYSTHGSGYVDIHGTKPQTLAYALTDSPVGLLGWIVEKFRDWVDFDGELENVLTRDEMLTDVMLYWVSGNVGASMRLYFEVLAKMPGTNPETLYLVSQKNKVPSAIAMFPHEILFGTKELCQNSYDLRRFTEFPRGGHFAALEKPDELVSDMKTFFLKEPGFGHLGNVEV